MTSQTVKCPNCGIEGRVGESCFKCNTKFYRSFTRPLYVIDVAHSGEDREDALRKVIKGIEIGLSGNHKGINNPWTKFKVRTCNHKKSQNRFFTKGSKEIRG